jgi:hypothetical protein
MMITVPATIAQFPYPPDLSYDPFYGNLSGLGQDDSLDDVTYDPDTGYYYTSTGLPLDSVTLAPITQDAITNLPVSDISLPTLPTIAPPSNIASATGPIDQNGNAIQLCTSQSCLMTGGTPTAAQLGGVVTQGTNSGLTPTQIAQIITSASSAGIAVFKATSSPSLIPGTNLVYNPATGQIANALTGLTGSQLASSLLNPTTLLLLGGALILVMLLDKK